MAIQRNRYGAWRGGPDPLAPPYDVRAAVDALGAEVLAGNSPGKALRDLLRRGVGDGDDRRNRGLDDLAGRARRLRRDALRRGHLDGAVTRARALLDQALAAERAALAERVAEAERGERPAADGEAARFAELTLDSLPRSTARAVADLAEYAWTSPEARAAYQRILEDLRRDVLDQRFAGLRDGLRGADPGSDPDANQRLIEALHDLNALLAKHAAGENTDEAFAEFMRDHGSLFPNNPGSVEELIDELARRAAAGERLMRSLTDRQREELSRLMAAALNDPRLANEMRQLTENLRNLRPEFGWDGGRGQGQRMRGERELGYGEAATALQEIGDLDDLLDQLGQEHPGATLDDIDVEAVERQLGRGAADEVLRLRELERQLREQGWVTGGDDAARLSPKALRRLGDTALREVFAKLTTGGPGQHELRSAGAAGEITGASRRWAYGDEQPIDVVRTVGNALRRSGSQIRVPVTLRVEDFEVAETARRSSAAVALCVDLSYSMISEGRWLPMKQTALALSRLTATRFRQDALQIVGFGRYALPLTEGELATIEPNMIQGTNLQHALRLAGRHLRRHPEAEPVVLVVTDGEPTAHLVDGDGGFSGDGGDGGSSGAGGVEAVFCWPPTQETIAATIAEVDNLTRLGATINLFMLGEDPGLRRFVDAVARRCGGRVLTPDVEDLGSYVIADYLRSRQGRAPRP